MGDLIQFPRPQSCFTCQHYDIWADGVGYCHLFDRDIDSEIYEGAECPGFEREQA